ncbi:hypothetical protein HY745_13385, partial [Candidatus Desantisbacteria bacterium]|nr:hypothetical protein [Candidatus Desantisbacteria bacterium]
LYMDNGALARAEATKEFMSRIGVEIKTHEPDSPEDTGKIEVRWKTLWSNFELPEFIMDPRWEDREYTLSDLHQRLLNYTHQYNQKAHPTNIKISKEQSWLRVMQSGGVIDIDQDVFDTVFRRLKRYVGRDGIVSIDTYKYFVKGLYDTWVYIYQGVFDGRIVAEDILSHKRYEAEIYVTPGLDEIKSDKKLASEIIREESEEIKKQFSPGQFKGIYEVTNQAQNLIPMPIRTKETKEVPDPFDVDAFPSLTEAMKELHEIVGISISQEQREIIENLIKKNGCKKAYVTDFALELRASLEEKRVAL